MAPEHVRLYVKAQKNGDRDAEVVAEAAARPAMRFVELKSEGQPDVQTLHRVRGRVCDRLAGERISLTHQIRSLLLERGHIVAQGHARLRRLLTDLPDPGAGEPRLRMAFAPGEMRPRRDGLDRRSALPSAPSVRPWPGAMTGPGA